MTDALPLSLLNDYLYCTRRAALKVVEGWRAANYQTDRGDIAHEHADLAGYEVVKGVTLLRALPVWSERLGLSGKCDIVEVQGNAPGSTRVPRGAGSTRVPRVSDGVAPSFERPCGPHADSSGTASPAPGSLKPVEFKVGPRRKFENDDVQVCAQALCLEEMFGLTIQRGAIFHADSKRRREVEFTAELRNLTEQTARDLHALMANESVPPAIYIEGRCEKCSLFDVCLPRITDQGRSHSRAAAALFQT